MLYPEALKEGQKAIDRVIGGRRLPSLEDRPELPFIDAIMLETLRLVQQHEILLRLVTEYTIFRWNPVAPLGK